MGDMGVHGPTDGRALLGKRSRAAESDSADQTGNNQPSDKKGKRAFYSSDCFFTINNPLPTTYVKLDHMMDRKTIVWMAVQEEKGKEGTLHLQGAVKFDKSRNINEWGDKLQPGWYKPMRDSDGAAAYCTKVLSKVIDGKRWIKNVEDGVVITPMERHKLRMDLQMSETYRDVKWKDWQQEVLDILTTKPNGRDIHWFWEPTGNVGKSFLARYLVWKHRACYVKGSTKDAIFALKSWMENVPDEFPIVLDLPRDSVVNYNLLEEMGTNYIFCSKYESTVIEKEMSHVIVFANYEPEVGRLSMDRWKIRKIE